MLISSGYSDNQIKDLGQFYLVDGDVIFDKKKYKNFLSEKNQPTTRVRIDKNTVTQSNVKIWINPYMNSNWIDASRKAIKRWNNVLDNIYLTLVINKSDADIEIQYDTQETNPSYTFLPLSTNIFGRVESFPTNDGKPGGKVWINNDFNYCYITRELMISNIQHEIGHNLGFHHTNSYFGNHISGTPKSDSKSLMNGGMACNLNDFSDGDVAGIKMIYGSNLIKIRNFTVKERRNTSYSSGSKFDYEFDIIGDYSYSTNKAHQINLTVYKNFINNNNEIGRIYWNREDDYDIIYPNYTKKSMWVNSLKNYSTFTGNQYILKVEYAGKYKLYFYTY